MSLAGESPKGTGTVRQRFPTSRVRITVFYISPARARWIVPPRKRSVKTKVGKRKEPKVTGSDRNRDELREEFICGFAFGISFSLFCVIAAYAVWVFTR